MSKKTKTDVNLILYTSIGAIIVLIAIILLIINFVVSKPSIAFYKVPQNIQAQLLKSVQKSTGKEYRSVVLDDSLPLPAQKKSLKHSTVLFAYNDLSTEDFATTSAVKPVPAAILNGMPTTIGGAVKKFSNTIKAVPVVFDFYQIDVNYPCFQRTGIQNVDYWNDLINVLMIERNYVQTPVVFAGGNDSILLNVVGMLTEAFAGKEEYDRVLADFYSAFKKDFYSGSNSFENIEEVLARECAVGGALHSSLNELNSFLNNKIISPDVLQMQMDTANFYADNNLTAIMFLPLSHHRNISREIINDYRTIYCPSYPENFERKFAAPDYCVLKLKRNKAAEKIVLDLASSMQTEISTVTGLAPVQKNCAVADRQSDDVRYWLAASSGPLKPFDAAFPTTASLTYAANYIRGIISSNNF